MTVGAAATGLLTGFAAGATPREGDGEAASAAEPVPVRAVTVTVTVTGAGSTAVTAPDVTEKSGIGTLAVPVTVGENTTFGDGCTEPMCTPGEFAR
jgi:hypothetical protein